MLWCVACVAHIAHTYMQTYRSNQNVASEFSLKMCGEPLRCSSPVKPCPLAMRKGRETVGLVTADLYTVTTSSSLFRLSRVQALQNVARDPLLPFAMQ